jgi:hypothetical protein
MLVRDYLNPAAVKAEVLATANVRVKKLDRETGKEVEVESTVCFDRKGEQVRRLGFHQFRRGLSSFLTTKKKVGPKTAQARSFLIIDE